MADKQGAKERAEFAAMKRATKRGFTRHEPAYSAEEIEALRRGEGVEAFTAEELAHLLGAT